MGTRKTAMAVALVKPGTGKWLINKRPSLLRYFPDDDCRLSLLEPMVCTESVGRWDVRIRVSGGGFRAQAEASGHALARAIANFDRSYHAPLVRSGLFKVDIRQVERKKPGQKKARKKFQWVRR